MALLQVFGFIGAVALFYLGGVWIVQNVQIKPKTPDTEKK